MRNTPERQLKDLFAKAKRFVGSLPIGAPPFSLSIGWAAGYDGLFDGRFETSPETAIIDEALKRGRVLITGRGGSGKTFLLHRLMSHAVKRHILPIIIDMKNWTGADYQDWEKLSFNPAIAANFLIERFGRPQVSALELDWIPPDTHKLLFLDGLNEIAAPVGLQILRAFNEFVTGSILSSIVVADRLVRRDLPSPDRWSIGMVQPLSRRKIQLYGGGQLLKNKGSALLDLPFFLDAAVRSGGLSEGRAATHSKFFAEHSGLNEQELNRVAKAAFEAYAADRTRTFRYDTFVNSLGPDIVRRLEHNGILLHSDKSAQFSHHLQHDYFAARYLAGAGPEQWSPENLDAISFRASSFDSVALVFEQISAAQADLFLRRVFDWNLYAAGYTLAEADPNDLLLSPEMQTVILAMLAEKKFDIVEATRLRAHDALGLVRLPLAEKFRTVGRFSDLIAAVNLLTSTANWFNEWREAYTKPIDASLSDEEVASITEGDSILGWTFANVMKRTRLPPSQQEALRGMLVNDSPTVRWRIAHVLGSYPNAENVAVLARLIADDENANVRYGAARSLAELACRASPELRKDVVELVTDSASIFMEPKNERVLKELADALIVMPEEAPEDWSQVVIEIAREFYLRSESVELRDRWRQYAINVEIKYPPEPSARLE